MTKDEALKLALEALEEYHYGEARIILRQALEQPVQEPVARVIDNGTPEGATEWIPFTNRVEPLETGDLLYTTPPQRPWVGLTDDDLLQIRETVQIVEGRSLLQSLTKAIEAKLKEKNT